MEYKAWLEPVDDITRVTIRVEISSANPVVWLGAKLTILARAIDKLMSVQVGLIEYEIEQSSLTRAEGESDPLADLPFDPPELDQRAERRLPDTRRLLGRLTGDEEMSDRLVDYLKRAPDDFLGRIRPLELAHAWRADADRIVDLLLAAHRAGLMSVRWEILCPRCRNSKTPSLTLDELPLEVHCTTCNIDYERDFSRNVELLFSPEPWLRPLPDGAGCMLGASTTPHIVVQRHVEPGEELIIDPPLSPGAYRIRAPQLEGQHDIEHGGEGFPELVAKSGRLELGGPGATGRIALRNLGTGRATFVIEELAWRKNAVTGDQAIARAAFRRYCPDQLLRPGDDVRISNVVLLFTDLKGSTSLYEAIGDAAAYKLVRDHFVYLTDVVEAHRGTLIKTMGDAIMAAFSDGWDAVTAAIRLQSGVADFNRGRDDGGVVLKIGLHQGSCIAVTADGRLDYFGSMVNLAARLQGESHGGDIVLSTDLVDAVQVADLMPEAQRFEMAQASASLRGFDHPVGYWRLTLQDGASVDAP